MGCANDSEFMKIILNQTIEVQQEISAILCSENDCYTDEFDKNSYELINNIPPKGKKKISKDPRNNHWRNSKRGK